MVELCDLAYQSRGFGSVSLSLEGGQVVMVCGRSGSGKSTLCQLLLGDLDPSQGLVSWVEGTRCGFLGADPESQLLGATVEQELELSLRGAQQPITASWLTLREQLRERFRGRMAEDPHQLSKGEQQILLVSSLVMGSYRALLLDEGLSGLDEVTFGEFCRLLRQVAQAGGLVVLVSHEPRLLRWADRVLGMDDGKIVSDRPAKELTWGDFAALSLWPGVLRPGPPDQSVWTDPGMEPVASAGLGGSPRGGSLKLPAPLELGLEAGTALALAGVSGSGKSRLLHQLFFSPELAGIYRVMLTESPGAMLTRATVLAELKASLRSGSRRGNPPGDWELPPDWLDRSPRALSTGQQKLVVCRCLLLQAPDLLLLEEPFAGLDRELRAVLERWLREYLSSARRLVFTTHNPDEMCLYPNTLVVVERSAPIWVGHGWMDFTTQPEVRLGRPGFARQPI